MNMVPVILTQILIAMEFRKKIVEKVFIKENFCFTRYKYTYLLTA